MWTHTARKNLKRNKCVREMSNFSSSTTSDTLFFVVLLLLFGDGSPSTTGPSHRKRYTVTSPTRHFLSSGAHRFRWSRHETLAADVRLLFSSISSVDVVSLLLGARDCGFSASCKSSPLRLSSPWKSASPIARLRLSPCCVFVSTAAARGLLETGQDGEKHDVKPPVVCDESTTLNSETRGRFRDSETRNFLSITPYRNFLEKGIGGGSPISCLS